MLDRARSTRGAALMGVCNVTPDSFSDGGRYLEPGAACARVDELLAEGADIIDIGGESTRPGAGPVSARAQIGRVIDVVKHAVSRGACVSIDTGEPAVAQACLECGAAIVNDASCLRDVDLARVVAAERAALILMHTRGTPAEMVGLGRSESTAYGDVVADVSREWQEAAARAFSRGVPRDAIVMDPGLGFAKGAAHSFELISRLGEFVRVVGAPVAVGASRKSFLKLVDPGAPPVARIGASIAAALHSVRAGAAIVRVHDVRATRQALDFDRRTGRG